MVQYHHWSGPNNQTNKHAMDLEALRGQDNNNSLEMYEWFKAPMQLPTQVCNHPEFVGCSGDGSAPSPTAR